MKKQYIIKPFIVNKNDSLLEKERQKRLSAEKSLGHKMTDVEWFEYKRRFIK